MRVPLQTYGFSLMTNRPVLDLRNAVEGTEDILYFLTLRSTHIGHSGPTVRVIDDRDDGPHIEFPSIGGFQPLVERLPVRGPVGITFNDVFFGEGDPATFTGHVELEGPDYPSFFIPIQAQAFDDVSVPNTVENPPPLVCRVESSVNLSLFVYSPHVSSKCTLRFVPDEAIDPPVPDVKFEGPNLELGQPDTGFIQVFDRMPMFGPGRIEIDIDSVNGGPISLYGFLSD